MNFGYYAHEEEEETKGNSKHVDPNFVAGSVVSLLLNLLLYFLTSRIIVTL